MRQELQNKKKVKKGLSSIGSMKYKENRGVRKYEIDRKHRLQNEIERQ